MRILMYHEITPSQPTEIHAVWVEQFAAQMAWLNHAGYQVVQLQDWIANPQARAHVDSRKAIAITFDDGYLDNYTIALPILEQYHFSATIFLATGYIGKTSAWRSGQEANTPMLDWHHVYEMSQRQIRFGTHTVNHVDLLKLDLDCAQQELFLSRQQLAQKLGKPVILFSYPYSQVNNAVKQLVISAGYAAACTYEPDYAGEAGKDIYQLNRIGILATDSMQDFVAKIRGSWRKQMLWYKRVIRKYALRH